MAVGQLSPSDVLAKNATVSNASDGVFSSLGRARSYASARPDFTSYCRFDRGLQKGHFS
jgi:hypothetical protein